MSIVEFGDNCVCIVLSPLELGSREEVAIAASRFAKWYMYVYACHRLCLRMRCKGSKYFANTQMTRIFLLPKLWRLCRSLVDGAECLLAMGYWRWGDKAMRYELLLAASCSRNLINLFSPHLTNASLVVLRNKLLPLALASLIRLILSNVAVQIFLTR